MSTTSSSVLRRPLQAFAEAFEPKPVIRIYGIGVVFWILMTLVLGLEPGENNLSYALLEAFGTAWQSAFFWSLGIVVVATSAYCMRVKCSLLAVVVNAMIYALPYTLFLLGIWTLDTFYENHPATMETIKLFGPILMLFYVIGIFYMAWRAPGGREEALPAFMLSTSTAVILVLALTGFKLFTSNDYIYRNAFGLTIEKVDMQDQDAHIEGTLTINKSGDYRFSMIKNEMEMSPDQMPRSLTIEWVGESGDSLNRIGDHRFRLVIPNVRTATLRNFAQQNPDQLPQGPEAYLQISLPKTEGRASTFLKSLPVWLDVY